MNYTADDIANFFSQYRENISHVCVLHTDIHTFGLPQRVIERKTDEAKADLRHALNVFCRLLYPEHPNYPRRKPRLYRPLCFVTIEGASETLDRAQTVHFNLSLGNLPRELSTQQVAKHIGHAWHEVVGQSDDIFVGDVATHNADVCRWIGYGVKEAQKDRKKAWLTEGVWDVCNSWIPHEALKQTEVS